MTTTLKNALLALLGLFSLASVTIWPVNKYEWMLEESKDLRSKDLPIDEKAWFYALFSILPVLILSGVTIGLMPPNAEQRYRRLILCAVIAICISIWIYRFHNVFAA